MFSSILRRGGCSCSVQGGVWSVQCGGWREREGGREEVQDQNAKKQQVTDDCQFRQGTCKVCSKCFKVHP